MRRLTPPMDLERAWRKEAYVSKRWRTFRRQYLKDHKNCVNCAAPATLVDHTEGHGLGWYARFWTGPFQPMCDSCHSTKSGREVKARQPAHVPLSRQPWRK